MDRRTNLFYSKGNDSNFLTFSNYTESLTGNFLSTNTKLFPSKFICFNLALDGTFTKEKFIKFITCYYENKLACLRDNYDTLNENVENYIKPLAYLLEAIYKFFEQNGSANAQESAPIVYIGDITEQDYNGTYADTICIVDMNLLKKYEVVEDENVTPGSEQITVPDTTLHGWANDAGLVKDLDPIFDDESSHYFKNTNLDIIKVTSLDEEVQASDITLSFNCIVPLYDVTNINTQYNVTNIDDDPNIQLNDSTAYIKNVPLGMWLPNKSIELTKTGTLYPTWALTIGSQFKPFPYSNNNVDEISNTINTNAFATFAQVASRQNKIMESLLKIMNDMYVVTERLNTIESKVNRLVTKDNTDALHLEIQNMHDEMENEMDEFKAEIREYIKNITWKVTTV